MPRKFYIAGVVLCVLVIAQVTTALGFIIYALGHGIAPNPIAVASILAPCGAYVIQRCKDVALYIKELR